MSRRRPLIDRRASTGGLCASLWWLTVAAVCSLPVGPTAAQQRSPQFDTPVEPLIPRTSRSEADRDQIEAQALFATARLLEDRSQSLQSEQSAELTAWYETAALRKYQRAFRRDPQATRILRPIIALAQTLGRTDEAARYAAIATQRDPSDTALARWLALYYADQGEWDAARRLYESIIATRADQPHTATPPRANLSLWLELGRLAYLTQQYAQASAAFAAVETALQSPLSGASDRRIRTVLLSNGPLAFQLFGAAHLEAGNLEAAEAAFRRGCEGPAGRNGLAFHLAQIARRRRDSKRAGQELQKYLDSGSAEQGIAPYQLLADLLADQAQQDQLVGRLEKLHQDAPGNLPLATFLAQQHLSEGQLVPAEALFQKVLNKIAPDREPQPSQATDEPLLAIGRHAIAPRGDTNDDLTAALAGLAEIYRRQDDTSGLLRVLAETAELTGSLGCLKGPLAKITSDRQQLERIFEATSTPIDAATPPAKTTAGPPTGSDSAMAELALMTDRLNSASHFYRRAIDRHPTRSATLLRDWGLALLDRERYTEAAEVFQQGIARQLGPKAPAVRKVYRASLYFFLAGALEMTGDTDGALTAARQATALQPNSALIASRLPWIYRHTNRPISARKGYQRLIDAFDISDHDRPTRKVLRAARFELAQLAIDRNDLPAAQRWLEEVLDEDPQNPGALNDLGFLWADQGKHLKRALRMTLKAVAEEPDNRAYRDSLGWAYFRLGHYQNAIDQLEKAVTGKPPDGVVLDHLGDCYDRLGRRTDAAAAWRQAVRRLNTQGHAPQADRVQEKLDRYHRRNHYPKNRPNRSRQPVLNQR